MNQRVVAATCMNVGRYIKDKFVMGPPSGRPNHRSDWNHAIDVSMTIVVG